MADSTGDAPLAFEEARIRAEKALREGAYGDELLEAVYNAYAVAVNDGNDEYLLRRRTVLEDAQRRYEVHQGEVKYLLGRSELAYKTLRGYEEEYGEDERKLPESARRYIEDWSRSEPRVHDFDGSTYVGGLRKPTVDGLYTLADIAELADEALGKYRAQLASLRDKAWLPAMGCAMMAAARVREHRFMRAPLWNELEEKPKFACREVMPLTEYEVTFKKKGAVHAPFKERILDYVNFCVCDSNWLGQKPIWGRIDAATVKWHVEMHGYLIRRYVRVEGLKPWNGSISTKMIRTWRSEAGL